MKEFKTVKAPPRKRIGQPGEAIPIPERRWYQWINDAFTRLDELGEAQLKALNVIIEQNNSSILLLSTIAGVAPPDGVVPPAVEVYKNYMSEVQLDAKGVVNAATPIDIEVLETLGRTSKYGFIYSETGTLILKFNEGGAPVPLKAADFFDIHDQHLEIEKLRIAREAASILTSKLNFKENNLEEELESLNLSTVEKVDVYGINIRTGEIIGDDYSNLLLNDLTPEQRVIYLILKRIGKPLNIMEISQKVSFSRKKIIKALKQLERMKLLERVKGLGHGKYYRWKTI